MKIWYIHNYTMLPEHGALNRGYYLGKYLKKNGEEPVVFVGSHPHNTRIQLIEGKERFRVFQKEPFPWVLIKTRNYEGSKISRVLSMFEFYRNMKYAAKRFERPDVIIGSSAHPLAALLAIRLSKKYGCKGIVEVRDLWPESIVIYGIAKRNNPIIKFLYVFEKYLYRKADSIIFTMEAAYDYIESKGWQLEVPKNKVFYLNNGVDLEQFIYNRDKYIPDDKDITDKDYFKVVYTGSIRRVNNVGLLLDVALLLKNYKIKILIYGTGDEIEELKERKAREHIDNLVLKGFVEKKYIPFIVSHADINLIHGGSDDTGKYGTSQNKMFDYFAGGRPILRDTKAKRDPILEYNVGVETDEYSAQSIADGVLKFYTAKDEEIARFCENAKKAAQIYNYKNLALKLIDIIKKTDKSIVK